MGLRVGGCLDTLSLEGSHPLFLLTSLLTEQHISQQGCRAPSTLTGGICSEVVWSDRHSTGSGAFKPGVSIGAPISVGSPVSLLSLHDFIL